MITAIIIDDDATTRVLISELLQQYVPEVQILSEAATLCDGINEIRRLNPQLVFLDMKLPDRPGYELFSHPFVHPFRVVIISAYQEYAYNAINFSPACYITKPVQVEFFVQQVRRVLTGIILQPSGNVDHPLLDPVITDKLIVKTDKDILLLNKRDVVRCEADGGYTIIHRVGENKIITSRTLKSYLTQLTYPSFLRPHQSFLVNTAFIKSINRSMTALYLTDNTEIPISSRKRNDLTEFVRLISA